MRAWWLGGAAVVAAIGLVLAGMCAGDEEAAPERVAVPERAVAAPASEPVRSAVVEGARRRAGRGDAGPAAPAPAPATTTAVVRVMRLDGTPAAGAAVDLHRVENGPNGRATPFETSAVTGADGVARVEVRAGAYFARARSGDELGGSHSSRVPQSAGMTETTLAVTLRPAVLHRGRVMVEGTGVPIPGARVQLLDRGLVRDATTDADGRVEFRDVAHNPEPLAWAEAFGYVDADRRRASEDERSITWTLTMHPALVLRGTLRGPEGPVAKSGQVQISRGRGATGGVGFTPGADGRFEVTFRSQGALFVRVPG